MLTIAERLPPRYRGTPLRLSRMHPPSRSPRPSMYTVAISPREGPNE